MPVVEEHAAPGSSPEGSPRVVRVRRVSQVVATERSGRRGTHAPELEAEALLRDRFLHHLTTMVKLSNLVRAPLRCDMRPWRCRVTAAAQREARLAVAASACVVAPARLAGCILAAPPHPEQLARQAPTTLALLSARWVPHIALRLAGAAGAVRTRRWRAQPAWCAPRGAVWGRYAAHGGWLRPHRHSRFAMGAMPAQPSLDSRRAPWSNCRAPAARDGTQSCITLRPRC